MSFFSKSTPKTDDTATTQNTANGQPTLVTEEVKETEKKLGKKGGNHMMMTTTAGLIVGATVGGIAGAVLSDEETRKVVGEKLAAFAKNATATAKRLSDNADKLQEIIEENAKIKA